MSPSTIVLIALLALFIGVLIPVLVQLRATLRQMERRLETTGARLDKILDDSEVVTHRLARVSSGLEGGEETVHSLMTSLGELSRIVNRTSSWLAVGAAVGPAVASAVRAYRERGETGEEEVHEMREETVVRETVPGAPAQQVPGAKVAASAPVFTTHERRQAGDRRQSTAHRQGGSVPPDLVQEQSKQQPAQEQSRT